MADISLNLDGAENTPIWFKSMHFYMQPVHVLGILSAYLVQVRIHDFIRLMGANTFVLKEFTLFLIQEARV